MAEIPSDERQNQPEERVKERTRGMMTYCVFAYPSPLDQIGYHHDDGHTLFPYHTPKVSKRRRERPLSTDVSFRLVITLRINSEIIEMTKILDGTRRFFFTIGGTRRSIDVSGNLERLMAGKKEQ